MSKLNAFQEWCKEILPVVLAAARGDVIEARFIGAGDWVESQCDWECFGKSREYRIKPRTITVNGFEVPEPIREAPAVGTKCYLACVTKREFVCCLYWDGLPADYHWLRLGLWHSTEEAAVIHAKAMLGIDPNQPEE